MLVSMAAKAPTVTTVPSLPPRQAHHEPVIHPAPAAGINEANLCRGRSSMPGYR
jgi:hypothetical protein